MGIRQTLYVVSVSHLLFHEIEVYILGFVQSKLQF